jgi:hypothetical protein
LLETKNIAFWAQAKAATMQLPPDVRAKLEIRELPIAVAVSTSGSRCSGPSATGALAGRARWGDHDGSRQSRRGA